MEVLFEEDARLQDLNVRCNGCPKGLKECYEMRSDLRTSLVERVSVTE